MIPKTGAGGAGDPAARVEGHLERARSLQERWRLFTRLDAEGARRAAEAVRSPGGLLAGLPVTLKDLILTRDLPTTGGSRALGPPGGEGIPGERDAALVARLRRAGAVVLGKTNLNELAYGITGENHWFGDVPNPWDPARMAGGSSSGSAAALALGVGEASLGTDTRGSIRIPAACCGVTGFKPSRGLVPTEGIVPLSPTLDHAGPLAWSVEEVARLLDPLTGSGGASGFVAALGRPLDARRIGVPGFFMRDLAPSVEARVGEALAELEEAGLEVVEVEVPELEESLEASGVIAQSEAVAEHDARLGTRRDDLGPAVLERLLHGYERTALELVRAHRIRDALADGYARAFREVELMAGPTLPALPAPLGATTMEVGGGRQEWIVDASCRLTAPQNMTGTPALSVPCGFSDEGLPVGLQLWGPPWAAARVLKAGHLYQRRTAWHERRPPAAG